MITVPLYFLGGVMISAYLVDRRRHLGQRPLYELVMGLATGALALVAIGGAAGFFGEFGEGIGAHEDYFLLALLCGASGLQNAALTSASGATIRTTHLTGLTTDLGIGLIRAAWLRDDQGRRSHEIRSTILRMGTIASFFAGSGIGAVLYVRNGYLGFALPATIAAYATGIALIERRRHKAILSSSAAA
jgi:uncharacterized membrane protein YoaK (UPF0700 family)